MYLDNQTDITRRRRGAVRVNAVGWVSWDFTFMIKRISHDDLAASYESVQSVGAAGEQSRFPEHVPSNSPYKG